MQNVDDPVIIRESSDNRMFQDGAVVHQTAILIHPPKCSFERWDFELKFSYVWERLRGQKSVPFLESELGQMLYDGSTTAVISAHQNSEY